MSIYTDEELPPTPTKEEVALAFGVLINLAMLGGGELAGAIERFPLPGVPGRSFMFHFSFHDARICADAAHDNITVSTLQ